MDFGQLIETTVTSLGYELVDVERSAKGAFLRIFIDKPDGVSIDDCAAVSNQLSRVMSVEGVNYDRLEVSSPGLDRSLRSERDFSRFVGEKARIKLRTPREGQRNFVGTLRAPKNGTIEIEVDGEVVEFELSNLDKARLVPNI